MRRLAILGLFATVTFGWFAPPFYASRQYLHPYWATDPRLDKTHYAFDGYFALFGTDSTKGSLRIFNREATGKAIVWRLVGGTADTTRIDSLGVWTNGDIWGQTVHYTTLDPAVVGSVDTLKRGLGLLARGTYTHAGESLAFDSSYKVPHATFSDSGTAATRATLAANATNAYNADSLGHVVASGYVKKSDSTLLSISSGRVSWDLANGGSAFLTMTSNCTLNLPTNITPGRLATLTLIQDSTGSRLATWASGWKFCGDTATTGYATAAPTLTATGYPTYAGDVFMWLGAKGYMVFLGFSPAVLP